MKSLTKKSVIILDNAKFHRMETLKKIAKKYKHIILPLPPYSPELNPIEKAWANLKRKLRNKIQNFTNFETALSSLF